MHKIYFDSTGPAIRYGDGLLLIEDLNPEQKMRWRMSRWEMVKVGFRSIFAALAA